MDLEMISREWIKPSSPTPSHLKTYELCLIDQYIGHHFPSVLLFYPLNINLHLSSTLVDIDRIVSERLQLLKKSLSEALTLYYPLAGKIKDDMSVQCNDEGIYFVEARAKIPLNQFLNQPNRSLIGKLSPVNDSEKRGQIKEFCFMRCWSALAEKNIEGEIRPDCGAASLFPPSEKFLSELTFAAQVFPFLKTGGRVATRRFVFDAKAIAKLKAKATSSRVQNPTRIEAVSALLSKRIFAALNKRSGTHKPNLLRHISLQGDEGFVNYRKAVHDVLKVSSKAEDMVTFTSWCNGGLYNIDFGWGKPVWMSFFQDESPAAFMNLIILMDTRLGDGIEALVSLREEDMAFLESDEELLTFIKGRMPDYPPLLDLIPNHPSKL
ncbi:vinorine synthase-like [Melia azedarach]|uniref:Vinorine synthase-like n=1 Tax=Melia azedarach TaxID=155640 RepID=A0ACC1XV56_MELAZ|nr:vinorine synthase-like [Melia azedarach]